MNPLLEPSKLPFEAIDFNAIKVEHFLPALDETIKIAKENLEKIKQVESPTFQNVIEAMETSSDQLDLVVEVFYGLHHAHCTDDLEKISEEFSQKLTNFTSDINLDPDLFKQVKNIYDQKDKLGLKPEELMVLENTYKGFTRNGALLNESDKETLRAYDQKLSQLSLKFGENARKSTNEYVLEISDEADVKGMPEGVLEAAKATAKQKNVSSTYAFTLDFPSYMPFMQYCPNRGLRKKLYIARNSIATKGELDNKPIIIETLKLRKKRANLLGYPGHPEFVLENRMARDPQNVMSFLNQLKEKSESKAKEDFKRLENLMLEESGEEFFAPYDSAMYREILKKKELDFDDEELRPYFKLENVIQGVFDIASKLYGLTFTKQKDIPTYHEEVDVFEVKDEKGDYVGLFYTDFFPRAEKSGGAWMGTFRNAGLQFGEVKRPFVNIVCNFTKPTESKPSLLTLNEVLTLFHEFGHALHGLLAKSKYKSVAGTNVYWDFVELPSQIMENWVMEKDCLDMFAKHYETGEPMPAELVKKIKKSGQFLEGLGTFRQLSLGYLDMSWHTTDPEKIEDPEEFESKSLEPFDFYKNKEHGMMSASFGHIFAGGYAAGYYSYKWAEVLDADAFSLFQEKGIFNKEVATSFKENILEMGGSINPTELFKKFRGREPSPDALLKRAGLI